jgi:hypothetical protein
MIKTFPPLNGPYASEEEDDHVTDYCIGRKVIYAAFAWSLAAPAYKTMVELAERHHVGFFDVSGDSGKILIPVDGRLQPLGHTNKTRWWKFW